MQNMQLKMFITSIKVTTELGAYPKLLIALMFISALLALEPWADKNMLPPGHKVSLTSKLPVHLPQVPID